VKLKKETENKKMNVECEEEEEERKPKKKVVLKKK